MDTYEDLKSRVSSHFHISQAFEFICMGNILSNLIIIARKQFISIHIRQLGGKGAFGSQLKVQGGRMAAQKTTNFESCRDLSGRRLKTMNEAKRLADYIQGEPERKRQEALKIEKKIKEGLKENTRKVLFDDKKFEDMHDKVMDEIDDAVKIGLKRAKGKGKLVAKKKVKKQKEEIAWSDEE
jgi:hypothetical protein